MKSHSFRYAALMTALLLACIGLPAIAQSPVAPSLTTDHSSALMFAAGTFDRGVSFSYLATSTPTWVPVRDGDHDSWKDHHRKDRHMSAPEGGSPMLYLLLAALSCCGALIYSRRRAHARRS